MADAVLVVHTAFIAFVVLGLVVVLLGGLLGWRWVRNPWFRLAHLACILYVAGQALAGIMCPLTTWENDLRIAGGQDPYTELGFIATWLQRVIFFQAEPIVFTLAYCGFALLVVLSFVLVPVRWRRPRASADPPQTAEADSASPAVS